MIPFPWTRFSDDAKAAMVDSIRKDHEQSLANAPAPRAGGAGDAGGGGGGMTGGGARPTIPPEAMEFMLPRVAELPDYLPAFGVGALRADEQGRAWIRTTEKGADTTESIFYIVDRTGKLTARVAIPNNRAVVGFGRDGSVYLMAREGVAIWLERRRVE